MDSLVQVNEIIETIRERVEELPSVQTSYIFSGEMTEKDFDYFKGDVEYGTTCLITAIGGDTEENTTKRTLDDSVFFSIFVVGINDINLDTSIANSTDCLKTIDELKGLVFNNNFGYRLLKNKLKGWQQVENTIDEGKRISIYIFNFELTFKSVITDRQYLR